MAQHVHLLIGGGGGIGTATVQRLKDRDDTVVIAHREESKARERAEALGVEHAACDAASFDQVQDLLASVIEKHGRLDGVANLAGSIIIKPINAVTEDDWRETVDLNLTSAFATVRAASRPMKKAGSGSIVLMSSCAARIGLLHHEAIAAAKAGVIGLTQSAAAGLAGSGVRVNCVAPGLTDTPMAGRLTSNDKSREASEKLHPLGRLGQPEDIARAIEWLLTEDSSWVTGQTIGVDGGLPVVKGG
jgi:NAD(P)-dependent dehydrogenase (short-subunit alcohol dehydrogenase family)